MAMLSALLCFLVLFTSKAGGMVDLTSPRSQSISPTVPDIKSSTTEEEVSFSFSTSVTSPASPAQTTTGFSRNATSPSSDAKPDRPNAVAVLGLVVLVCIILFTLSILTVTFSYRSKFYGWNAGPSGRPWSNFANPLYAGDIE